MARRINHKFLLILTVTVLGLGLTGLVVGKLIGKRHGDPQTLIREGDKLYNTGDFEKARDQYGMAVEADPVNTEALVKMGDALAKMASDDPSNLDRAHLAWNKAVSIDPGCGPALSRLLDSYWDYLELSPKAELYVKAAELAEKLLAVEPDNKEAAARRQLSVLQKWVRTQVASVQEVQTAMAEVQELIKKDPANPDLPFWLAQAKIRQGQDLVNQAQRQQGQVAFEQTAELFDDVLKGQKDNGPMQFRGFQTYVTLLRSDPRTKDSLKRTAQSATQPAVPQSDSYNYKRRAHEAITAAVAKTSDKDEVYHDVQRAAADWYNQNGQPDKARKVIETYYNGHKDDQRARLAMAKLLGRGKDADRAAAIKILSQEAVEDKDAAGGFKALMRREQEALTVYELALMRLGEYAATLPGGTSPTTAPTTNPAAPTTNPAAPTDTAVAKNGAARRKELEPLILDNIDKLRRLSSGKNYRVLGLEGRLHLLKQDNVTAVNALREAVENMGTANDIDLMFLLARAYLTTRQQGQARNVLDRIVNAAETWPAPRILLADLLLQEGDGDSARRHLAVLKTLEIEGAEAKAEVKRLDQYATVLNTKDAGNAKDAYDKMPEQTAEERAQKARVAVLTEKPDEAIRLLKANLAENPKDVLTVRAVVGIYESRHQKDRARELVEDALKASPDDLGLRLLALRLADAKPEEVYAQAKPLIEKTADEFTREVQLYDLERGPGGKPERALAHLERAFDLRPNDVRIVDTLYGNAVNRRDWAKAEVYLKKLVELNADECGGLLYQQRYAMARQDYQQAEDLGVKLVERFKDFAASWLTLGQAQQALGKFEEAARSYAETRKRQPKQYDALRGLVDCYYQINRPEDALSHLREARGVFPKDVTIREMFLNHLVNYGNPAEAIPDREKLWKENPDDANLCLALAATYFHTAQRVAADPNTKAESGKYLVAAGKTLEAGSTKFPDDPRFYAQMAEMLQYAGQIGPAEGVLRGFAQRESMKNKPLPYLLLADLYNRIGRPKQVQQALGDALLRADRDEQLDVRLRLASAYAQDKMFKEAAATLSGANRPDDPRVVRQNIEVLIASGDLAQAETAVRQALQKRDGVDLRTLLASILIDTGRVPEAQNELAAAQRIEPRSEVVRYLQSLSMAKQAKPDIGGAIQTLVDLRNRNPRNAQVRLLLAELYANTARIDYAIRELDDALKKVPLSKEMRLKLIQLYRAKRSYGEALELATAAQRDPVLRNDPAWPREKAIIHMQQKQIPMAIMEIDRVVQMAPERLEYHRERLDMILQFNDFGAVIRESDKLLAQGHDEWWLRHQRGLAFAKRTEPPLQNEPANDVQALAEFDKALAHADRRGDPNTAEFVLRGMAGAVTRVGADSKPQAIGYDEALKRVNARLSNDPDNRWGLLQVALYRAKNDFATAAKLVDALLANPANQDGKRRAPILRAAADVFQSMSPPNWDRTEQAYVELLSIVPTDLPAMNNLAYVLSEGKNPPDPQRAKVHSRNAYNVSRNSGQPNDLIYDTHGWVLTLCGGADLDEGIKILQDVVNRRPDMIDARYHLGMAYMKQPNPSYAMALQQLQAALDLIDQQGKDGGTVDKATRDKVAAALVEAKGKATGR